MKIREKIVAITPFICLIAFVLIGYYTGKWHPAWTVFILIPLMPFLVGLQKIRITYPLFILIVYIVLGIIFKDKWWHPGWVIFLTIPVYYILFGNFKNKEKKSFKIKYDDKD
jgi:hypothetical protein